MIRNSIVIGCCIFLFMACLQEKYKGDDCRREVFFLMKDVPYVFVDDGAVAYRPYYTFTEILNLYIFTNQHLDQTAKYDYAFCRDHPVIPQSTDYNAQEVLFVANLYDSKALHWSFDNGQLQASFSIIDYEEPPVLLAKIADIEKRQEFVEVELRMLVSRLEIKLVNPPSWLTGLDVTVRDVAKTVSTEYALNDTTHIQKTLFFNNQGAGTYWFGVNTFPTFQGKAAQLSIVPIGTSETSPILVDDEHLHLLPGVITRLNIVYDTDEKITLSIEIDGKWEIIDGGNIII